MITPPSKEHLRLLEAYPPEIGELTVAVRRMVVEEAPFSYELLSTAGKEVTISFTFTGQATDVFAHIATNAKLVELGFDHGAELPDPSKVLRGEGKTGRYLPLSSISDLERPWVINYVREAVKRAKRLA